MKVLCREGEKKGHGRKKRVKKQKRDEKAEARLKLAGGPHGFDES